MFRKLIILIIALVILCLVFIPIIDILYIESNGKPIFSKEERYKHEEAKCIRWQYYVCSSYYEIFKETDFSVTGKLQPMTCGIPIGACNIFGTDLYFRLALPFM